jgi:peroxiredoxin
MAVNVGDEAPDFTLPEQDGTQVHLRDLLQKSAVPE